MALSYWLTLSFGWPQEQAHHGLKTIDLVLPMSGRIDGWFRLHIRSLARLKAIRHSSKKYSSSFSLPLHPRSSSDIWPWIDPILHRVLLFSLRLVGKSHRSDWIRPYNSCKYQRFRMPCSVVFRRGGNPHQIPKSVQPCIPNIDQVLRMPSTNCGTGDKCLGKRSSLWNIECIPHLSILHNWIHNPFSLHFERCAEERETGPPIRPFGQRDCQMRLRAEMFQLRVGDKTVTNVSLSSYILYPQFNLK